MAAEGFARLLLRLAHDPDTAGIEYERLRLALVKFFDWRGAWSPDECADETLDRLADKLSGETAIDDVKAYGYGIARLVLLERLRRQAQNPIEHGADVSTVRSPEPETREDSLHECFEQCLSMLPEDSQRLVLQYYVGDRQMKIDNRRKLARALGLSDNALRSRVQRVRDRLERCVESCVAAAGTGGPDTAVRHETTPRNTFKVKNSDAD